MKPEQAKAVAEVMVALWNGEVPATVRVLSAVNSEQRNYRPHDKSRSGWELATHIATADVWFLECIARGEFAFDPEAAKQAESAFRDVTEVAGIYESTVPAKLRELLELDGAVLAEDLSFFGMMVMPRAQWIGFAAHHSVHHRGQLSTYLRPMGGRVPDIYGASADAEPMPAAGADQS